MVKRIVASALWFVVTAWACNYLGYYFGLPFLAGPIIAAAAALFVGLDPFKAIWPRPEAGVEPAHPTDEPLEAGALHVT